MNEKVMVVDDEPDIVRIVKIALELKNYSVIEASSGEECLEKLESGEIPHLILLDIMLPGINGYDVYHKVKEKFNKIKIALFSAKAQTHDIEQGTTLDIVDHITKPFDPYELIERVTKIFKNDISTPPPLNSFFQKKSKKIILNLSFHNGKNI
jgi:two-component system response regulator VicR